MLWLKEQDKGDSEHYKVVISNLVTRSALDVETHDLQVLLNKNPAHLTNKLLKQLAADRTTVCKSLQAMGKINDGNQVPHELFKHSNSTCAFHQLLTSKGLFFFSFSWAMRSGHFEQIFSTENLCRTIKWTTKDPPQEGQSLHLVRHDRFAVIMNTC